MVGEKLFTPTFVNVFHSGGAPVAVFKVKYGTPTESTSASFYREINLPDIMAIDEGLRNPAGFNNPVLKMLAAGIPDSELLKGYKQLQAVHLSDSVGSLFISPRQIRTTRRNTWGPFLIT